MIRFVDCTRAYWDNLIEEEDQSPMCAFINTITNTFEDNAGSHLFDSLEEVQEALGERGVRLVPKGFFSKSSQRNRIPYIVWYLRMRYRWSLDAAHRLNSYAKRIREEHDTQQ